MDKQNLYMDEIEELVEKAIGLCLKKEHEKHEALVDSDIFFE